ncbi:homeodomain mating type protein alpha2 [Kluyveromyces marxianus]|nr:homeodomain mating type protein alpha2 [Kluyveromyces marxianus]KAG0682542.1 homeodomain mating type protein alpha2 [Kluyveromyces marxianus]
MSKIPVQSLLNPESPREHFYKTYEIEHKQSQVDRKIQNLLTEFKRVFQLVLLSREVFIQPNYVEIYEFVKTIRQTLIYESGGGEFNTIISRNIFNSVLCLLIVLQEKQKISLLENNILSKVESFKERRSENTNTVEFRILSSEHLNPTLNKVGKKNRFPKKSIKLLENWYECNRNSPYLTSNHLDYLECNTGLNKTQIKNWVANRRRKDKNSRVSLDIKNIFRQQ